MPRKMSIWANCSLKISDLELGSWLLWGVLSVGNSLGVIGWEADLLSGICFALLCACEPAWHGLWVYPPKHSCSFLELSWRQGKWSESAKSELCSCLRCGEEWGSLFISYCSYGLSPFSSFLHIAFLCKSRVSSVIQLNPHIMLAKTPCAFWFSDDSWAPALLETIFRFYFCVLCCCTRNWRLW